MSLENGRLIPIISEQTRTTLLTELSLDKDWRTVVEIEHRDPPGVALPKLTEEVMDDLTGYNPRFVQRLFDSMAKVFVYQPSGEIDHYHIDSATEGMAIVLRAYQLDTGSQLFYNIGDLKTSDLDIVGKIIADSMVQLGKSGTYLERVLGKQRIPEQHAALNSTLNRASGYTVHYSKSVKEGGTAMFKILSGLWTKLSSAEPTPENS